MKSPFSKELFGLDDISGMPERLYYNRPSNRLIVTVSRELDGGLRLNRLFHRELSALRYSPVQPRDLMEDQREPRVCEDAPYLFFSEWQLREDEREVPFYMPDAAKIKAESPQGWFADWRGIRRFDLSTGEDRTVLDEATLRPPSQYPRAWVSKLMNVSPDGKGGICIAALHTGGFVHYCVYDFTFADGLTHKITDLPRIFF